MEDEDLLEVGRTEGCIINEELFHDGGLWRIMIWWRWVEWRVT